MVCVSKKDMCICENTLVKLWKENCPIVKRERSNCAKRPMNAVGVYKRRACRKKTCVFVKWDLRTCEKRPVNLWKETCKRVERERWNRQRRPVKCEKRCVKAVCVCRTSAGQDAFICDMITCFHMWNISFICDMTHCYKRYMHMAWLIHMWHDSFIFDMTHSFVAWLICMWHDSFICGTTHSYPPAPMNHVKIFKGWPLRSWYNCGTNHFHQADFCLAEMKKPTMLSNKSSTAWSCAENQLFENKSSEQDFKYLYCTISKKILLWNLLPGREYTWLVGSGGWHDSFVFGMTHSYMIWLVHIWYDSFMCDMTHAYVTWLIHMWPDSFICDVTQSYVIWLLHTWHDSFICDMSHSDVTWLIDMWHDSFIRDMTHSCACACVTKRERKTVRACECARVLVCVSERQREIERHRREGGVGGMAETNRERETQRNRHVGLSA